MQARGRCAGDQAVAAHGVDERADQPAQAAAQRDQWRCGRRRRCGCAAAAVSQGEHQRALRARDREHFGDGAAGTEPVDRAGVHAAEQRLHQALDHLVGRDGDAAPPPRSGRRREPCGGERCRGRRARCPPATAGASAASAASGRGCRTPRNAGSGASGHATRWRLRPAGAPPPRRPGRGGRRARPGRGPGSGTRRARCRPASPPGPGSRPCPRAGHRPPAPRRPPRARPPASTRSPARRHRHPRRPPLP